MKDLIIAVDFDGTCVTHEYPKVGRNIGAEKVLRELTDSGVKILLWTMRSDEYLEDAIKWFKDHDIPLYGINTNPTQYTWTNSPKAYAKIYIDDAALGAPLKKEFEYDRPFIDWERVKEILFQGNKI